MRYKLQSVPTRMVYPHTCLLINIVIITSFKNATYTTISHRDNNNWETVSYEEMHLKDVRKISFESRS